MHRNLVIRTGPPHPPKHVSRKKGETSAHARLGLSSGREPFRQGTFPAGNLSVKQPFRQGTFPSGNLSGREPFRQGTFPAGNLSVREPFRTQFLQMLEVVR
jgi:hypothetical protein